MRRACSAATLVCLTVGLSLLVPGAMQAFELPPVQRGANLGECVAALEAQGGGWCEMRLPGEHPSISSVWPDMEGRRIRMNSGPKSILRAWNGAAFDEARGLLYFTGGGHADYGGNEVYEFDLSTGKWARLTDPSPLTYVFLYRRAKDGKPPRYCWSPDMRREPASVHNYDGLQFSRLTETIFLVASAPATGACFNDETGEFNGDPRVVPGGEFWVALYEFNPSREETRNGLEPLTWRNLPLQSGLNMAYPRSMELPDGRMMLGGQTTMYNFDPIKGEIGARIWEEGNRGDGTAEYHPSGVAFLLHRKSLRIEPITPGVGEKIRIEGHGKSLAIDERGIVYAWNGKDRIMTFDRRDGRTTIRRYDWEGVGPASGPGRVYSKWQYVSANDVFVGIAHHETGVWVYKHPEAMPGEVVVEPDS